MSLPSFRSAVCESQRNTLHYSAAHLQPARQSMLFPATVFTKLTPTQQHYVVPISCTKFHQKRIKNVKSRQAIMQLGH
jgi:hypothetical protein